MLDVRMDLLHTMDSDAMTFGSCRKVINVALFKGEFGTAEKVEETIAPRNYPQAAASLRRIGRFLNDLGYNASNGEEEVLQKKAKAITDLKVGGLVITIFEKVEDPESEKGERLAPVIVYNIPIRDGRLRDYQRRYETILREDTP